MRQLEFFRRFHVLVRETLIRSTQVFFSCCNHSFFQRDQINFLSDPSAANGYREKFTLPILPGVVRDLHFFIAMQSHAPSHVAFALSTVTLSRFPPRKPRGTKSNILILCSRLEPTNSSCPDPSSRYDYTVHPIRLRITLGHPTKNSMWSFCSNQPMFPTTECL